MATIYNFDTFRQTSIDCRDTAIPRPSIPQELTEIIIDFARHDAPSLRTLALAHPNFSHVCQKYLFSTVTICPPNSTAEKKITPAQRFLQLLNSSPHISRHVRALTIECQGHSEDDEPWLHTDTSLHLILPLLSRLTKIAVVGGTEPDCGFRISYLTSWSLLSSNLRSALTSVLRSASVVDIEIGGFSLMPISFVSKRSSLKRLSLLPVYLVDDIEIGATHTTPSGPTNTTTASPVQRSELEEFKIKQTSITLRRTTEWLHSPGCYIDVTRLRNLSVHVVTLGDHTSVARILETCSSSLENLSLDVGSDVNTVRHIHGTIPPASTPASSISLASLPGLRSLTLHVTISRLMLNNRRFADPFPWLVAFLETLPSSNTLSELEISVEVAVGKEIFNKISWKGLVRVLVSERMSSLSIARLKLRLKQQVLVHGLPQVLEGMLNADEHLRELRSRRILEVDVQ